MARRCVPDYNDVFFDFTPLLTTGYNPDHPGTWSGFYRASHLIGGWVEHVFVNVGGDANNSPLLTDFLFPILHETLPPYATSWAGP